MSLTWKRLEAEVLDLPQRERARLARRLIASLEDEIGEDLATIEAAWEEEILRRLDEHRTGVSQSIPAEDVFAEARTRLRRA